MFKRPPFRFRRMLLFGFSYVEHQGGIEHEIA
jgi:hypothetical protein